MWRNNLQESFSLITNHPWAQHLTVSLLIVICLHYYHSSSSAQTRRQTDIPNDLLLREEDEIRKKPPPIHDNEVAPTAAPRKPKNSTLSRATKTTTTTQESSSITTAIPPAFRTLSDRLSAYWHWHDTETSLFRVYEIAQRNGDTFVAIPPFTPSSRRGNVRIHLRVTNMCATPLKVYWMDYQGREIWKGDILPCETWHQTTWIDHPWVFRQPEGELLLYYVPYRVIPTCDMVPTVDPDDIVGIHRFSISHPLEDLYACSIQDPVLPFPAHQHLTTPAAALQWALIHCTRMGFRNWELLMQCGTKIIQQPDKPKYRSFRQGNPQFGARLWNTTARGVLLAGGFYENAGYVQFGASHHPLGRNEVQELSLWVWTIQKWLDHFNDCVLAQPTGADGFGRAGYGRAGQMT
ncbi:hypothetical protein FisN_19Lh237 [Fistulifera solaris]|uniref:Uncharacterized protein n=1 Tax=Fistulifera solaris TaxID=1519565 RepID=A0A1Z5K7F6_FISSO|nr:hypothetical protein FisN_19Lh237 [Fistulifera solaris]|eukprot:GAX22177.1 hypothetical protein FisN_19Lh237 [Fistulifera solaris]